MWRISISTCCIRCFVRVVSDGTTHSRRRNYRASGGRKSVRGPIRKARDGIKPSRLNTSVQLFGHGNRTKDRRNPDSECRAIGLNPVGAARAAGAADLSIAAGCFGQDPIRGNRNGTCIAGDLDRHFQAAANRSRHNENWRKGRRFNLEASESFVWRDWNFRLRRRGSFNWKFPGELFRTTRDRVSSRQNGGWVCVVLLGRRHDRTFCQGRCCYDDSNRRPCSFFVRALRPRW